MKVFVYFNLHRKCLSVKALEGPQKGRVVAHAKAVALSGVTFKVSEAGRQRVIREQRKNVHGGVVGQWDGHGDARMPFEFGNADVSVTVVTYNPYKAATFVERATGAPMLQADMAYVIGSTIWAMRSTCRRS